MVKTPILFETFVRDDFARQVFEVIKKAKPCKLYFYSNKGRNKDNEIERNDKIRSWVKEVDWDCELHTFFRDECVDVYTSLKGAVDWVFENEESAIVLEDDVVPTLAFFDFCDQMIEKFKDDRRVWNVSGDNFWNLNPSGYDYIFSHYHWTYGWATWKDRWLSVSWNDPKIDEFVDSGLFYRLYKTFKQGTYQNKFFKETKEFINRTKCWDFMFGLAADQSNSCSVYPKEHLVTNIGLTGAHHQKDVKTYVNNEASNIGVSYPIVREPLFVFADQEFDYQLFKLMFPLKKRIKLAFKRFIFNFFGKTWIDKIKCFFSC